MQLNRKYQDSVFTNLFSKTDYTLQLYQALYPDDTETRKEDIKIVTLKNVLAMKPYNDLGFQVKDQLFILVEAQSTWSENITLRCMGYFMYSMNQYVHNHKLDIYQKYALKLPEPKFIMVYTGNEKHEEKQLSLSEVYGFKTIDLLVDIIYDGTGNDILHQYIRFVQIVKEQLSYNEDKVEAVNKAIEICTNENILKEYLNEHRWEVRNMLFGNIDQEFVIEAIIKREREESEKKHAKEMNEVEQKHAQKMNEVEQKHTKKIDSIILAMYKNGDDINKISATCNESEEYVKKVIENSND